jgi:hypothetical protein
MITKTTSFIILLLLLHISSFAQLVRGTVIDEKGEPAVGASVYFDGTTIGTTTNALGQFVINPKQITNSALVVSYIGYEVIVISKPFIEGDHTITLTPKFAQIREVTIRPDPFTREQKMKIFKKEFLGNNRAARLCVIENEDDIELFYDYDRLTLVASSTKPLRIQNPYLGYKIEFNLVDFYIKFNKVSVKHNHVSSSLFLGTSLFIDQASNNKKITSRRENSYEGSQLNFFRDMAANKWGKEGFVLFSGSLPTLAITSFAIKDTLGLKKVTVLPSPSMPTIKSIDGKEIKPVGRSFNLLYRNKRQSSVNFKTNTFIIDTYGNNSHPDKIFFGGDLAKFRMGNQLPLDYKIDETRD